MMASTMSAAERPMLRAPSMWTSSAAHPARDRRQPPGRAARPPAAAGGVGGEGAFEAAGLAVGARGNPAGGADPLGAGAAAGGGQQPRVGVAGSGRTGPRLQR